MAARSLADSAATIGADRPRKHGAAAVVTIATDNGAPFRFQSFIASLPEPNHVQTKAEAPTQNGSRERGVRHLEIRSAVHLEIDGALLLLNEPRTTASSTTICPRSACLKRSGGPESGRTYRSDISIDRKPASSLAPNAASAAIGSGVLRACS